MLTRFWASFSIIIALSLATAPGQVSAATTTSATWAWGNNRNSQLGYESWRNLAQRPTPAGVLGGGASDIVAVAGGKNHSLALKNDGTVWSWGDDLSGERGIGSAAVPPNIPAQVVGLTGVTAIDASAGRSIALRRDGTVWAWGDNYTGQLGIGTEGGKSDTPVQVHGPGNADVLRGIVAIAAGYNHMLALASNGTVYAWGGGLSALGNTDHVFDPGYSEGSRPYPLPVVGPGGAGTLGNIIAIAAGNGGSIALDANGAVWAWGDKLSGEFGDDLHFEDYRGTTNPRTVPGLPPITAIAAGGAHRLALDAGGHVWGWGLNSEGQVGNGTWGGKVGNNNCDCVSPPIQVGGLANIRAISGGDEFSLALQPDGTVVAWGRNSEDEIGATAGTCAAGQPCSPALHTIAGLDHVSALDAGFSFALVIRQFAIPAFSDLQDTPYAGAIQQLAARQIINGYQPGTCQDRKLAAPCFGPTDPIRRAEMAGLITRSMGWLGESATNPFPDQCEPRQSANCIDNELWADVAILASSQHNVVHGYPDGTYAPFGPVLHEQVLLFISRALIAKHAWDQQPDDHTLYPNIPDTTAAEQADRADISTFVHYVGAAPGTDPHQSWDGWDQPSSRGWFAQTLWQALSH